MVLHIYNCIHWQNTYREQNRRSGPTMKDIAPLSHIGDLVVLSRLIYSSANSSA